MTTPLPTSSKTAVGSPLNRVQFWKKSGQSAVEKKFKLKRKPPNAIKKMVKKKGSPLNHSGKRKKKKKKKASKA